MTRRAPGDGSPWTTLVVDGTEPERSSPQNGDIVILQERLSPSGPCSLSALGDRAETRVKTYADALRRAKPLAISQAVDVWTTYRVRWADAVPQTFRRLASHRRPLS